jgi:small subunit ribosomal protein S9
MSDTQSPEANDEQPAEETAPAVETPSAEAEAAPAAAEASLEDSEAPGEDAHAEEEAADVGADLAAVQAMVAKPAKDARYTATGKRKTSVARVIITPGDGSFWVNGRSLDEYFPRHSLRTAIMEPMTIAGAVGSYHVRVRLHGGGVSSQAGALRHGISRALAEIDPQVRTQLKSRGFLKLDARQVERKKAGLKKARKRPQFSKR